MFKCEIQFISIQSVVSISSNTRVCVRKSVRKKVFIALRKVYFSNIYVQNRNIRYTSYLFFNICKNELRSSPFMFFSI